MRKLWMQILSLGFISIGFLGLIWMGSSLLGNAIGQDIAAPSNVNPPSPQGQPGAPPPTATAPMGVPPVPTAQPPSFQTPPPAAQNPVLQVPAQSWPPAQPPSASPQLAQPQVPTLGVPPGQQTIVPPPAGIVVPQPMPIVEGAQPEFILEDNFSYDPTGLRDPFKPFGEPVASTPPTLLDLETLPENLAPLQTFDLGQIKVVGIMWEINDPKAMVRDPSGKLHLVRKQTKIGRRNGFIATIREGEIVIVEPVRDGETITAITKVLALAK